MRILHVIVGLERGGAELMLSRLVRASSHHEHVVVSLTRLGPVGSELLSQGINVICLNMSGLCSLPAAFWRLRAALIRSSPDVVQTWLYHADLLGGIAARLCKTRKVVWGIRNTEIPQAGLSATRTLAWLCAKLSRVVPDRIVCCAQAARDAHLRLGYCSSKMLVIPNGYDVDAFRVDRNVRGQARNSLRIGEAITVVGVVGRFDPLKDYENFVRAAGIVARSMPHARFLMIGRGLDESNAKLTNWIQQTGHADRFMLLGERQDVHQWMAAMDVFCLSSKAEGFPNVVAEAMAMSLPCVVTDAGDARLMIQDSGVVVPTRDPTALAAALTHVLQLPAEQRNSLGARARKVVETQFSIQRAVCAYDLVYRGNEA